MTWGEMSKSSLKAAALLRDQGLERAAVNRVYYSVYSLAVERVAKYGPFGGDLRWSNPPHNEVPLLLDRFTKIPFADRGEMKKIIKELFKKRVEADYKPNALIDEIVEKSVFRKALRFQELISREPISREPIS